MKIVHKDCFCLYAFICLYTLCIPNAYQITSTKIEIEI